MTVTSPNADTTPDTHRVYRVVQWAAGRIGRSAMRAIIRNPGLDLVGLYVHSESKEGEDAGELSEVEPVGIKATRNIDDIIALAPDCVLYMQEGFDVDDMSRLLESGINIITSRGEFIYADAMQPDIRERIEASCLRGGSSVFATGSSPGFSTAVLPIAMCNMSTHIDCLTIDEFADIPLSTTPQMITDVMGFGQPLPDDSHPAVNVHAADGFKQALSALAAALHLELDGFEDTAEFAAATSPVTLPGGAVIDKGTIAAQRIGVAGIKDGKTVLQYRANWYCTKDIEETWDLKNNGWRVLVEGDTPVDVQITYPTSETQSYADQMSGLTAHPAVNAISHVVDAAPGILTNVDMPPVRPRLLR